MEAAKGFIFGRDKNKLGHSYLVSFLLITDEPLDLVSPRGETVIMGGNNFNTLTLALQTLTKYKPPHCLGDVGHAILSVSEMNPANLEKVEPPKRKLKNEC